MRQNWRPHSVVRAITTSTTSKANAVMTNVSSTQRTEFGNSLLQSIDGLNVVFIRRHLPRARATLRRSYRSVKMPEGMSSSRLAECCAQMRDQRVGVDARGGEAQIAVGAHDVCRRTCGRIHLDEVAVAVPDQRQHGGGDVGTGGRD